MAKKLKELSPYQIIEKTVGSSQDPKVIYAAILEMVKRPNFRVLRNGNTLMVIDNHGDKTADVLFFTTSHGDAIVEDIQQLAEAMKLSGFNKLVAEIPNLEFLEVVKKAKLNYVVLNRGVGKFLITVTL